MTSEILAETRTVGASIGLRVGVHPVLEEIDKRLRAIPRELQDLAPAFRRIASEVIEPALRSAFAGQASETGTPWEPLSPDYAKRKHAGEILEGRTGRLRDSLLGTGKGKVRRFNRKSAEVGTSLPYAAPLQWGYGVKSRSYLAATRSGRTPARSRSTGKRSAVPARPFVEWSDAMRADAAGIMLEYLDSILATAFAGGGSDTAGGR